MPSISFDKAGKDGMPIAIVRGGDDEGKILSVFSDDDKSSKKGSKEIDAIRYTKDLKGLTPTKRVALFNRLQEAKEKGIPPEMLIEDEGIRKLYKRILSDTTNDKTIVLPDDSTFHLIPNPDKD